MDWRVQRKLTVDRFEHGLIQYTFRHFIFVPCHGCVGGKIVTAVIVAIYQNKMSPRQTECGGWEYARADTHTHTHTHTHARTHAHTNEIDHAATCNATRMAATTGSKNQQANVSYGSECYAGVMCDVRRSWFKTLATQTLLATLQSNIDLPATTKHIHSHTMYFLILRAFASEFFPVVNSSALQIEAVGSNIVILMHYHV